MPDQRSNRRSLVLLKSEDELRSSTASLNLFVVDDGEEKRECEELVE